MHPLSTKLVKLSELLIRGRSVGSALLMWQEKPAASTKKQDVLQDEKTLFKANSPIKQEYLFLNSPLSSAFYCIKSLFFFFLLPWRKVV